MIIFWGTRSAGKVDQRDGQYALTRFAHVYWIPLFPTSAFWMTGDGVGHEMKLSAKSVVAGYARTWALILGAAGIIGWGGTLSFVAAIAAVALGALSMSWTNVVTEGAKKKSDLNLLAFGTRCEPKLLPAPLAETLTVEAKARWADLAEGQSPSDIARFGTSDVDRAAAAYGVLRLTALTLPADQAKDAEADATRIAEGVHEKLQITDGGPYRSAALEERLEPSK